jgi:hypothetical protein
VEHRFAPLEERVVQLKIGPQNDEVLAGCAARGRIPCCARMRARLDDDGAKT